MNQIVKKSLEFHQTFKPERNCLNNLLMDLNECCGKDVHTISKITGIPTGKSSGKVVPTICYLEYMGLITEKVENKKYDFAYTALGEVVISEDPGLMEPLTLLLMHCMMLRKRSGADLWSYIISILFPKYHGKISKINLEKELELHFGKEMNLAPFNGTYNGLFEMLNIISFSGNEYAMTSHMYNAEYIYLYAYILYEYWNEWLKTFNSEEKDKFKVSETEITSLQLDETGFRFPFGWNEQEEYHALEAMHDKGIIVLNRQMIPFSIRRVYSKEKLIDLLYSELC